ncbi:MAG: SUMF1/EgtB/PvdO family nonheme iron enzyme [Chitinivibrionales bacterium]|nr:SUMF1/EgtB/PvdO family nonheme iron enzyme [Chitinivibrionales bacterium]
MQTKTKPSSRNNPQPSERARRSLPIIKFVCAFLCACFTLAFGEDTITAQRFTFGKVNGQVQIWSKDLSQWYAATETGQLKAGNTISSGAGASATVTFEPAITASLAENTVVSLDKLIVNRSKKNIRMLLKLPKGALKLKTDPLGNFTLLLTIVTPSATVDIQSAEAAIKINNDATTVECLSGDAKIAQNGSTLKSVVFAGNKAVIAPNSPQVIITNLADATVRQDRPPLPKEPKIAILSIQSGTVTQDNLERVSDFIAMEYEKKSNTKVLFLEDIRQMLQSEGLQGLLSCFSDSCISQIGNALGVDLVIVGNLGQLGNNYLFSLRMIDALRNNVLERASAKVNGDIGKILDEIPRMVGKLASQTVTRIDTTIGAVPMDVTTHKPYQEKLAWIKNGVFLMGSKATEGKLDETPPHTVSVASFYIDKYEVTREDFETVMGYNPSSAKGCKTCPVDNVTWNEAHDYCAKMGMHLPTEAQWEYACRAGTESQFAYGNTLGSSQANFDGKQPFGGVPVGPSRNRAVPVGSYTPNAWNLYDMHGNVAEWCADWYDVAYYGNSPRENPAGPVNGMLKVVRGGAWNGNGASLRSAARAGFNPQMKLNSIGFRCVKDDSDSMNPIGK